MEATASTEAIGEVGDDHGVAGFGYEPKMKRTLKSFTSFAIAFSFISITTGLFTTYGFALNTGGPAGIWMWVVAGAGQLMVSLIFAQLAAHIPLSGYSYQWSSRLTTPAIGWWVGWLSYAFLAIVVVSVDYALVTQAFAPLFGITLSTTGAIWITVAVLIVQAILIALSPRIVALLNAAAVGTEIFGIGLIIVLLVAAVIFGSKGSLSNLTSTGAIPHHGYFAWNGPFILSVLLGAYTIVGFESASNLAEETEQPTKLVPRAMWRATLLSGGLGLLFLMSLDLAIPSIPKITASPAPVAAILQEQLGTGVEKLILVIVFLSMFACGLVIMTSGSRLVWSMSRDRRFPGHQLFHRVSEEHRTPIWAVGLIAVGGIVLILALGHQADTLANLFTAGSILPALIYLFTVLMYIGVRKKLPARAEHFNLGRWEWPVIILALLWLCFVLQALMGPSEFWIPVKLTLLVLGIGAIVYVGFLVFDRSIFQRALEPEFMRNWKRSPDGE